MIITTTLSLAVVSDFSPFIISIPIEPEENSKDDTHTIDNELHLGKNASIPEVQHPRFQKPIVTSTTQRKKSILKPSRTFDRSSSDEQITKNNYFLEKGNAHTPHEPPSEISEVTL